MTVGKGEPIQTLGFFPALTCFSVLSNTPFGALPKFGARKLSSLYIFVAGVQLTSLPNHLSPLTPERRRVVHSLPLGVGARDIRFLSLTPLRTRISDLQFSLVIFILNKNYGPAVSRASALSIYSFICLFRFLRAVQLRYICSYECLMYVISYTRNTVDNPFFSHCLWWLCTLKKKFSNGHLLQIINMIF